MIFFRKIPINFHQSETKEHRTGKDVFAWGSRADWRDRADYVRRVGCGGRVDWRRRVNWGRRVDWRGRFDWGMAYRPGKGGAY